MSASAASPGFTKSCYVGIIAGFDRKLDKLFKFFLKILSAPSDINCLEYNSVTVYSAGSSYSDTCNILLVKSLFFDLSLD